jgi:membrane protein YdbS with pleckstrin-like domain
MSKQDWKVLKIARWFVLLLTLTEIALWMGSDKYPPWWFTTTLATIAVWVVWQIVHDSQRH